MRPLWTRGAGLRPDQALHQRDRMRDLPPLGLGVGGARMEDSGDPAATAARLKETCETSAQPKPWHSVKAAGVGLGLA